MPAPATAEASPGAARKGAGLLVLSAIVAALGSFLFGFDTVVVSGANSSLEQLFHLSKFWLGFTVSSALIGTMLGSLLVGRPTDWWGRRRVLAAMAVLFLVSAAGCALAQGWGILLFFRFMGGLAVGAASVVCPMYITEIAPPRQRGVLVAVSQLNIVVGILVAYLSNWMVAQVLGDKDPNTWRWMFGVMAVPALAFLGTVLFIPESPRWLVKRGRPQDARNVLERFGHENALTELEEIQVSLRAEASGVDQRLFQAKYLKPLLLACMIGTFNQLDGINAVLYYAPQIFVMAGAGQTSALMQSAILGLTNLVMTIVAMALIDRVGRKALLLVGSVTFVLSHALAAWVFHSHAHGWIVVAAMMGIVGSHAYSQGAIIWVMIPELLPNAVRASGSSAACFLVWVLCAAVSWSFPVVAGETGQNAAYAFGFFALMMVLQFFLVLKFLPETKGISLEALQRKLGVTD